MKITQKISIAITNINHLIDNTKDIINGLPPEIIYLGNHSNYEKSN